jgi:hypothetical protein
VAAIVLFAASAVGIGRVMTQRRIGREVDDLFAASRGQETGVVTEADLANLPEPVQGWLRWAGVVGKERVATARLKQDGDFRLNPDQKWMPFAAEQYFTTDPPGFVWSVSMRMFPGVTVRGRDRYADGVGGIDMRLLGLVPVAKKSGGGLNQGALLRYLGETIWFPAAALDPAIRWEGMDATSARATMSEGGVTASATFTFDGQGRPVDVSADRYNDAKGRLEPWSAPVRAYGEPGGVRVPVAGDGVWHYADGDFVYIRWRITQVEYNVPKRY